MSSLLAAVIPPSCEEMIAAVSGGADSAYLAWALRELATPRLVHIDHDTPAAPLLRDAATKLADHLGLSLEVLSVEVPTGPSWEGQARLVRRKALRAHAGPDLAIATGHHRDDQVETVLGNLIRGAGSSGLAGMAESGDGWFKPLLGLTRAEIRTEVDRLGLPFVDDPTNTDRTMRRNLLRAHILPALEAVNPGFSDGLIRTSGHLAADDAALETLAAQISLEGDERRVRLAGWELRVVATAVAHRVVRRALRILGSGYPGTSADVSAVMSVVDGQTRRVVVSGGIVVEHEGGFVILRTPGTERKPWQRTALVIPGTVLVGDHWIAAAPDIGGPRGRRRVALAAVEIGDRVVVRPAASGDRIDIGTGSKLVVDALREGAVPVAARSSWPVVEVRGRIAWLVGVRTASWAAVSAGEQAVMFETGAI